MSLAFSTLSDVDTSHASYDDPLAKAGLVVGPLRQSVGQSVRLSATLLGCLVCVICNSESFHSFCIMTVHILKMCTFYFVHI